AAAVVTTTGIRAAARETGAYVVESVLASDGDETQTGFGFSVGRHPDVLDPYVAAQFLGIIGTTLSAEAVLKGRSPFADRVGDEIAAAAITFVDDPTNVLAFSATQTDGEGLATRRNALITDGVLQGFLHNSYTARRMGAVSTGSAVRGGFKSTPSAGARALSLAPGTKSPDELFA